MFWLFLTLNIALMIGMLWDAHKLRLSKNSSSDLDVGNLSYSNAFVSSLSNRFETYTREDVYLDRTANVVIFSVPAYCETIIDISTEVESILNIVDNPLEFYDHNFQKYLATLLSNDVNVTYVLKPEYANERFNELIHGQIAKIMDVPILNVSNQLRVIGISNDMLFSQSIGFTVMRKDARITGFSSLKDDKQVTKRIYSLSSREAVSMLNGAVTQITDELVESGDSNLAKEHLSWLYETKILTEVEYNAAHARIANHQVKIGAAVHKLKTL